MKRLLMGLLFMGSLGHAFGQKDSTLTFRQEADLMMSHLPKQGVTTGILYDRVFALSGIHLMNQAGKPDSSNSVHFQQAFYELEEARLTTNPNSIERFLRRSLVHYGQEKKLIPAVLCYKYNILDPDLWVRGDIQFGDDSLLKVGNGYTGPLFAEKSITLSSILSEGDLKLGETYQLLPPMLINGGGRSETLISFRYRISGGSWIDVDIKNGAAISFNQVGKIGVELETTLGSGQVNVTTASPTIVPDPGHCDDPDWMRRDSNCEFWNSTEFQPSCGISYPIQALIPFIGEDGLSVKGKAEVYYYYHIGSLNPCTSESTPMSKPVIFVDGIDFYDVRKGPAIYGKFLQYINPITQNHALIGNILRQAGYDLAILNFPDGNKILKKHPLLGYIPVFNQDVFEGKANADIDGGCDYIERNAMTLVALIQKINARTSDPIVLTGSSMGGQIARYALAYMEKNGLSHNCRLYISQDSPHLGANIPMGVQYFLKFYAEKFDVSSARISLERKVNNPASREMLIQSNTTGGPDPLRATYYNNLINNGVPGSIGWPKLGGIRKIALVNGSLNGTSNLDNEDGNPIEAGAKMWTHQMRWFPWTASSGSVHFAPSNGALGEVFQGTKFIWRWFRSYWRNTQYNIDAYNLGCSIDQAPGGYYYSARDVAEEASQRWGVNFQPSVKFYSVKNRASFISTKSALGFHWTDRRQIGDLCENLSNRNLVCTGEIPFDAYYGENINSEHVTISKPMADWVLNEIYGNISPQATTTLPIQGLDVLCLDQIKNYAVSVPSSCTDCQNYWMVESGLGLESPPVGNNINVKALLNVGNSTIKFSSSNAGGCTFKGEKKVHFGKPKEITTSGMTSLGASGGFKTQLLSSVGTTFSILTSGPNNCDRNAVLSTNQLTANCSPDNIHGCNYNVLVKGTNQCGFVEKTFVVNCYPGTGGIQAVVDPANAVKGVHPSVYIQLKNELNEWLEGPFTGAIFDQRDLAVVKFSSESNGFVVNIQSLEPANYSMRIWVQGNPKSIKADFVVLKLAGSALSVSPNPAIKDVDSEVLVEIVKGQTSDNLFEVTVEDFNHVRQLSFAVEGRQFPIDIRDLSLGTYVVTVKGENSIFQEDLQLTLKGNSYLVLTPNPVASILSLAVVNPIKSDNTYKIVITDKLGNIHKSFESNQPLIEADVSDLPADLYYLKVVDGYQTLGKIFRKM